MFFVFSFEVCLDALVFFIYRRAGKTAVRLAVMEDCCKQSTLNNQLVVRLAEDNVARAGEHETPSALCAPISSSFVAQPLWCTTLSLTASFVSPCGVLHSASRLRLSAFTGLVHASVARGLIRTEKQKQVSLLPDCVIYLYTYQLPLVKKCYILHIEYT